MTERVEHLPKERSRVYRDRALGLSRTMESAFRAREIHGAALSALHALISASDALTVFYLGERSRGRDHRELLSLVQRLPLPGASEQARRVAGVLSKKNEIEYGSSPLSHREAERLILQVSRYLDWAWGHLPDG